jgi:hypothetical protein
VLAEVGRRESEDGRVDDRLSEEDEEHTGQHGLAARVGDNEAENGADRSVDRNEERRVDETSEGGRHEARDHEDDLHCKV